MRTFSLKKLLTSSEISRYYTIKWLTCIMKGERFFMSAKQQDGFGLASILKREGKALTHFLFVIRFGIET